MRMAPDAVFLHGRLSRFFDLNNLGLQPECKDICVAHTVLCLEGVLVQYVIMRHMTIRTGRDAHMTAVLPCGELRGHHMAIHARAGIIGQVGDGI